MAEPFWISTGDIREGYVPMQILTHYEGIDQPAFGKIDRSAAFQRAIAALSAQAQKIGCNGVIWIHFTPWQIAGAGGFMLFATGTAVRVTPPAR